ncbi:hypothetical protein H0H93_001080 [Arthromyces matolae]|nr:hypothetical protein H0H93_001080 [Arthromyces matolae]
MQRSATKRGTPNAMQERVTVSTFRKEKEGLKSITERKDLSAKMNQMWGWVKERRDWRYQIRKEVRIMNRSGDVEKVANLIRKVEEGKEPWKETTPKTDRWDTKTLKMVLANMLERTDQDLKGKTGYAFVKDMPYVSLAKSMDKVWPLHDKYLQDLESLIKKSGTTDPDSMDIEEDAN